jgi:hypothetical protein
MKKDHQAQKQVLESKRQQLSTIFWYLIIGQVDITNNTKPYLIKLLVEQSAELIGTIIILLKQVNGRLEYFANLNLIFWHILYFETQ